MTWRRFRVLSTHLPDESAFKRGVSKYLAKQEEQEQRGPQEEFDMGAWSLQEQLLAHVVDLLALANYQRGGGKGSKPTLLTQKNRRSNKPAAGIDVRGMLARIAPKDETASDD